MATQARNDVSRTLAVVSLATIVTMNPGIAGAATARQIPVAPPPMGWSSWNSFGDGISETLIDQQADALKALDTALPAATPRYDRLNIDDGFWPVGNGRNQDGSPKLDPALWTNGSLASAVQHIHADGLLAGAYTDVGKTGCAGDGGSENYYQPDMLRFAQQGFDYVKVDFCGGQAEGLDPEETYANVAQAVQYAEYQTQRRMYLSLCDWGFYAPAGYQDSGQGPWTWAPGVNLVPADIWRTSEDITFSVGQGYAYATFADVLENFHASIHPDAQHTGFHNDPDMMVIGIEGVDNDPANPVQSQAHMSLWAVGGAPLLIGANLTDVLDEPAIEAILTNPDVIAVDQDPRGLQAIEVAAPAPGLEIWARLLSGTGRRAVVLLNTTTAPTAMTVTAQELGLDRNAGFSARDLWTGGTRSASEGRYRVSVPAQGATMIVATGADPSSTEGAIARTGGAYPGVTATIPAHAAPGRAPVNQGATPIDVTYVNPTKDNLYTLMQTNGSGGTIVSFPPTGTSAGTISVIAGLGTAGANTVSFTSITGTIPRIGTVSVVAGPIPAFQPVYQADASTSTLAGTAVVQVCTTCSDGHNVGYVGTNAGKSGTLTINGVTAPKAGLYRVLVAYANGDQVDRQADVAVDGAAGGTVNFPRGKDYNTIQVAPMTVLLQQGTNSITFSNPNAYGPNISALGGPRLVSLD